MIVTCEVPQGVTILEAVNLASSSFGADYLRLSARGYGFSVFGKKRKSDYVLLDGDRIEICGPLIASPMDARRRRAKREHKGGKM